MHLRADRNGRNTGKHDTHNTHNNTKLHTPGDVHVEPDHGCVVSSDFETLEALAREATFGLQHFATYKCDGACACGGGKPARSAGGGKKVWPKASWQHWAPEAITPEP